MKRVISAAMILCMLFSTLAVYAGAKDAYLPLQKDDKLILGDANGDGAVNAVDANAIKSNIVNGDAIQIDAADFNANGEADARDVLSLRFILAGSLNAKDFDSNERVYKFTIAGNDISEYDVVIPEDAVYNRVIPGDVDYSKETANSERTSAGKNDNCTMAAEILQEFISKTTGNELEIVRGESTKPHMIYCHKIDLFSNEAKEKNLAEENYIYEVKNGDLHIYGTLRGGMYAAYEIVEKYLGLKFYCDSRTYSKKIRTSDIAEGTYVFHETKLEMRFSGTHSHTSTAHDYFFPRRQNAVFLYGCNDWRHGYLKGPIFGAAHTFYDYYFCGIGDDPGPQYEDIKNRYYAKWKSKITDSEMNHRAYYWQPCASDFSEESDFYYMFEGMLNLTQMMQDWGYDTEDMHSKNQLMLSASINDNSHFCSCKVCHAIATGDKAKVSASRELLCGNYFGTYSTVKVDGVDYIQFANESYSGLYVGLTMKFAKDAQEYFPGIRALTIIYNHTIPETIKPNKNVVIWYCGHYCNQHIFGSGDCKDNLTQLNTSNTLDETALKWWSDACHEAGTTIWFWEYAVNYHYELAPAPCLMDMWANYHYIYCECGVDGMLYEGTNYNGEKKDEFNFENLKCYLSDLMMWDPEMTYEEFIYNMKDFMYMFYGDGYEYIYQFAQYQQAAGDANEICFVVNHDRPWEMYSQDYLREHYEEARVLLDKALSMAKEDFQRERVKDLYLSWDFLALSAKYDEMYKNGNTESRKLYEERYSALWQRMKDRKYPIFSDESVYSLPDSIDFTVNPMIQFYDHGSDRSEITP